MAVNGLSRMMMRLRRTALSQDGAGLTDSELLGQYVVRRDEAAFEGLLRRHGPMVLGVCRRILGNESDAEDAFQATFLVFIRKAGSIRCRAQLGNWLYGVAHHTALKARAMRSQRRRKEQQAGHVSRSQAAEKVWQQVQVLLDAELSHLPDKYRVPIVLCELEGRTIKEAARHLGCPQGTVATRLGRGRALLARRLSKHGLELSGGVLVALLAQNQVSACLPDFLITWTVKAAASWMREPWATTGVISARAAALAEGVLKVMLLNKLKNAVFFLFIVAVLTASVGQGVGMLSLGLWASQADEKRQAPSQPPSAQAQPRPMVLPVGDPTYRLVWSPNGKVIATASLAYKTEEQALQGAKKPVNVAKSTFKLWDMDKGDLRLSSGEMKNIRIESLTFAPDGKTIALACSGSGGRRAKAYEVRVLDAQTGTPVKSITPAGTVRRVLFAPDGNTLAIGGQYIPKDLNEGPFHRTVQLWDMQLGKATRDFKQELGVQELEKTGTADGLRDLAFSPDGKLLAAADADWKVRLLDTRTGELRHTLAGHRSVVPSLAFSPDGKALVSASFDGTIRVWDVATGKERRTLQGNQAAAPSLAFSPDGKFLVSCGAVTGNGKMTGEAILWDTASWSPKPVLLGEEGAISGVAFSPDGKRLAFAKATRTGGTAEVWRLTDLLSLTR